MARRHPGMGDYHQKAYDYMLINRDAGKENTTTAMEKAPHSDHNAVFWGRGPVRGSCAGM